MDERKHPLPESVQKAVDTAPFNREALEEGARKLCWRVPDNFEEIFRSELADYAVTLARCAFFERFSQEIEEAGRVHVLPVGHKVANTIFRNDLFSLVRTVRDYGEYLGQGEALKTVSLSVFGPQKDKPVGHEKKY